MSRACTRSTQRDSPGLEDTWRERVSPLERSIPSSLFSLPSFVVFDATCRILRDLQNVCRGPTRQRKRRESRVLHTDLWRSALWEPTSCRRWPLYQVEGCIRGAQATVAIGTGRKARGPDGTSVAAMGPVNVRWGSVRSGCVGAAHCDPW